MEPLLLYNLSVPLVSHTGYISHTAPVVGKKTHTHSLGTAEVSSEMTATHVATPP